MSEIGRGESIGEIALPTGEPRTATVDAFAEFPSPWRLLRNRILPFARRLDVPNIAAILMRTTEVNSAQQAGEVARDADLCLRPPIDAFGVLDFARIDEIVEAGFRYPQQRLEQLRNDTSAAAIFPAERDRP